ncbi:MAG: aminotransferase class I/II-fold pyridoxal phosphate-dependent enzyme, partial [Pseudomonadota bacterium]
MSGTPASGPAPAPPGGEVFRGAFTGQDPIPEAARAAVAVLLETGRLHRYAGPGGEPGQATLLEREFAAWQGSRYCLAVTSCGQAMQIALRAAGVAPGDPVLMNAFTLAPVPGAIAAVGGRPVLVEIDAALTIDMDDLARKAEASGARVLLLSHMRGHLCDMDRLMELARRLDLSVIEDCAHTMGAHWGATRSGNFGLAACFSTQSYKHM